MQLFLYGAIIGSCVTIWLLATLIEIKKCKAMEQVQLAEDKPYWAWQCPGCDSSYRIEGTDAEAVAHAADVFMHAHREHIAA
jgi:hypothetical protein